MGQPVEVETVRASARRWWVLAVLCVAVFTTMVDTSIVNVALPSLVRELDASTRDLLWIVDSYNLVFGALVLAAGSLSDRFGRKGALVLGLAIFGLASAAGALATDTTQLTAARVVMGFGAAFVFPATLSIITNVFPNRTERATAIGAWGATAGLAVALGPITGGALLNSFWWGSIFVAMVPVALFAIVLVALIVPTSRDPSVPPLDFPGLMLSIAGLGTLVFTIIEAPDRGWLTARTLGGFLAVLVILVVFVPVERRSTTPMLDVSLFNNPKFSAASGSVAIAFFALFGFMFLVTQYFQFAKGYSALSTGVRMLPVALAVGITALIGTQLAVRFGSRVVVASGLATMSVGFLWFAADTAGTSYTVLAMQMVVVGVGIGLTSAPATEAIMDVVPPHQAGIGSAVNDATREVGGTLGVAVLGSIFSSLYVTSIDRFAGRSRIGQPVLDVARESLGAAQQVAGEVVGGSRLLGAAVDGFFDGFAAGALVAAAVTLVAGVVAAALLPSGPSSAHSEPLEIDLVDLEGRESQHAGVDDLLPMRR